MYKAGLTGFAVGLLCAGLAGCQILPKSSKMSGMAQQPRLSAAMVEALESPPPKGLVGLHCSGGIGGCEFAKLNNIVVIHEVTRQPTEEAIHASVVRFEDNSLSSPQDARYFITMRPGHNEVKVRFYPVTPDRAENFALIHDFRADRTYRLNMFRQRNTDASASLLSAATPDPLCVDLLENDKVLRRFCRPFDPATGLGEFLEQRIAAK